MNHAIRYLIVKIYILYNSFLNDYLRIFNSSFPLQTVMVKNNSTESGVVQIKLYFYILHYRLHSGNSGRLSKSRYIF